MQVKNAFNTKTFLPFLSWLKDYDKDKLFKDFVAGITVAVVLIPQVMAYAILAGLPPVYGLYAAFLGTAVAALWGSSRHLSSGPVALVSFLTLTALVPLAQPETPEFIALAIILALIIGLTQLLMGIFKLGFIMNFISHSVIAGFTTAAAIIIASTQIPNLFGFSVEKHEFVFLNFFEIVKSLPQTNLLTLIIGGSSIFFIIFTKNRFSKSFPARLDHYVHRDFSFISYLILKREDVAVIGEINAKISLPTVPQISFEHILALLPSALIISIVGFLEAYAVAKSICTKTRQRIDVNQELIGQGLAKFSFEHFQRLSDRRFIFTNGG